LPDDLLVENILPLLTLKEAAQTSILSRRWKTLWTFTTGDFDFSAPVVLSLPEEDSSLDSNFEDHVTMSPLARREGLRLESLHNERKKYAKWVNQVLNSHQGSTINGLIISFDLDYTYKSDLDSWIEFAIQKETANLIVELKPDGKWVKHLHPYPFPKDIFSSLKSNLKILGTLRLCYADVSGPDLEDILSNCTSLVALSILGSDTLENAIIYGPPMLKFLEIRYCKRLVTLQVSAWKLETLVYYGYQARSLYVFFAPKLHTLYLGDRIPYEDQNPLYSELSRVYSQIQTLILDFTTVMCGFQRIPFSGFPELKILRWFELKVPIPYKEGESLLHIIPMIKACPMLHTLKVEFDWHGPREACRRGQLANVEALGEKERLERLKKVEFRCFSGRKPDAGLAMILLEIAPNIEKLVFDASCPPTALIPFTQKIDWDEDMMAARECARKLAANHAPNATLTIL
jgi:hypothetical protein